MSVKIIFVIGIMIFIVSTIGFGSNLNSTPVLNKIGSNDNVSVPMPDVNITNIVLTESASTITSVTITVKNIDSVSHTYKICVIAKAGVSISDTVGSSSDCTNTSTISASNTGSAVINFSIPLSSSSIDYADISIQEIV